MKPEIQAQIIKRELNLGKKIKIVIDGSCMEPFLFDKQKVNVDKCNITNINIGDIVLLFAVDSLRVHRIVHIDSSNNIYTKGDNAFTIDPHLDNTEIIGIVSGVEGNPITTNIKSIFIKIISYLSWKESISFNILQKNNINNFLRSINCINLKVLKNLKCIIIKLVMISIEKIK